MTLVKSETRSRGSSPWKGRFDVRGALRELADRLRAARQGGCNRTRLRRIRSAAWFAASDGRFVLLIFALVLPSMLSVAAGLPVAVPAVLIAIPFGLVSAALLCDTVLAFWEKRLGAGILALVGAVLIGLLAGSAVAAGFLAHAVGSPGTELEFAL